MTTATQDPAFYLPENPLLARLVECAKAAAHDDCETSKRIHRAAALVEAGAVAFDGCRCTVKSGNALYPVTDKCPCPDMVRRGTPCKHLYAKWLAIRLAQEEQMAEKKPTIWHAYHTETHARGLAIEDGAMTWFWADLAPRPTAYNNHVIVLLADKAMQDAARTE